MLEVLVIFLHQLVINCCLSQSPVGVFRLFEQVELSAEVHVLGSLPDQLPDQTPWHPLQVALHPIFCLFRFPYYSKSVLCILYFLFLC